MAAAQVYAQLQENIALRKSIDPELDIASGLMDATKSGAVQGAAFGLPHAFSEIGRGGVPPYMQEQGPRTPTEERNAADTQKAYQRATGQIPPEQAAPELATTQPEAVTTKPAAPTKRSQAPTKPAEPLPEPVQKGPLATAVDERAARDPAVTQNAIDGLVSLGIKKKQAADWVGAAQGTTTEELIRDALRQRETARQIPPAPAGESADDLEARRAAISAAIEAQIRKEKPAAAAPQDLQAAIEAKLPPLLRNAKLLLRPRLMFRPGTTCCASSSGMKSRE
jgi:hypothetical protein